MCSVNSNSWDPMDGGPLGILQARILKWVAISSCKGSSWPRDWTCLLWPMQEHSLPLSHLGSPLFMWPFSYIRASVVAQLVKNLPALWETWVWSLGWEERLATSVFWPRKVHWVAKSQMCLSLSLLLSPLPLKIQERMKEMVGIFWKRVDCKMLLIVLIFNII